MNTGGEYSSILVFTSSSLGVQFSSRSVAQLCPTLCNPMDCSMPGLPFHHLLPVFIETHVHWVGYAIQPSHPPSFFSSPTFNLSQHHGLFQWVSSSYQVAKVLELQHQPSNEYLRLISFMVDWFDLSQDISYKIQSISESSWFQKG